MLLDPNLDLSQSLSHLPNLQKYLTLLARWQMPAKRSRFQVQRRSPPIGPSIEPPCQRHSYLPGRAAYLIFSPNPDVRWFVQIFHQALFFSFVAMLELHVHLRGASETMTIYRGQTGSQPTRIEGAPFGHRQVVVLFRSGARLERCPPEMESHRKAPPMSDG